jgi:hypothetical protein
MFREGDLADLRFVLKRVAAEETKVDYWNHTGLGHALARKLQTVATGVPDFLLDIQARAEFWQYMLADERRPSRRNELLPIGSVENRALYVRLAAYGMIGSATEGDEDLLIKLASHDYGLIARDAAIRLVRLRGEGALRLLSERIDETVGSGTSRTLAEALRACEIELHGLARLW